MKIISLLLVTSLTIICHNSLTEQNNSTMNVTTIETNLGKIAYYKNEVEGTTPVLFLHGVYYDHNLWNYHTSRIKDRTVITIDMPLHGSSDQINGRDWTMQDCAKMLIEILDKLKIEKCYAIGHSWGSMTILRAASQFPERFAAVGLCNMPLEEGSFGAKLQFGFQHLMLGFRDFYVQQVGKAMFSSESRIKHPEILEYLELSMSQLSNKDIRKTDRTVISGVDSGWSYLENLRVPALAIYGKQDYVPKPTGVESRVVSGKHTSPLEQPEEVLAFIKEVIRL